MTAPTTARQTAIARVAVPQSHPQTHPQAQAPKTHHTTLSITRPSSDKEPSPPQPDLRLTPHQDMYEDDALISIKTRALRYLRAGAPVHFTGPAGFGKTTLALQVAAAYGRPVVVLTGDQRHTATNVMATPTHPAPTIQPAAPEISPSVAARVSGGVSGLFKKTSRTHAPAAATDQPCVLSDAIRNGKTLVYDAFTRSPAEALAPLIAASEERTVILGPITDTPPGASDGIEPHPEFRVIFTSTQPHPGRTHPTANQPAPPFADRMISFDLSILDAQTEAGMVSARANIAPDTANTIVALLRAMRAAPHWHTLPSLRTAIMIAQITASEGLPATNADPRFVHLCADILAGKTHLPRAEFAATLAIAMRAHCGPKRRRRRQRAA